jgi:hypothetical protein
VYFVFPVPPVLTRPAFGTCIDHVLTKFPEKVVFFGTLFSSALTNRYCIRPPLLVDRFVSYKDVNCVDADFLGHLTCRFHCSLILSIICIAFVFPFGESLYLIRGIFG